MEKEEFLLGGGEDPDYPIYDAARASSTYAHPWGHLTPEEGSLLSWMKRSGVSPSMEVDARGSESGRYGPAAYRKSNMTTFLHEARKMFTPQDERPGYFQAEPGGSFVLGHEFGHHLQSYMGIGEEYNPQFDADLTAYVLAEKMGEPVSLADSSAKVVPRGFLPGDTNEPSDIFTPPKWMSLLDAVKKRHTEVDSMVTAWGGNPY